MLFYNLYGGLRIVEQKYGIKAIFRMMSRKEVSQAIFMTIGQL
jgi:hypothetical protein